MQKTKRIISFAILTAGMVCTAWAQPSVWVKVEQGQMLFLEPLEGTWVPLSGKQEVPPRTFVLAKPNTEALLFQATEVIPLPTSGYFFLHDALPKTTVEVVGALTRIEAAQLPISLPPATEPPAFGLTYGQPPRVANPGDIPFAMERAEAIAWFIAEARYEAALLSLKRTMTKFPELYQDATFVEPLLNLYDRLGLYGFLLEEARRLQRIELPEPLQAQVENWLAVAQKKLMRGHP